MLPSCIRFLILYLLAIIEINFWLITLFPIFYFFVFKNYSFDDIFVIEDASSLADLPDVQEQDSNFKKEAIDFEKKKNFFIILGLVSIFTIFVGLCLYFGAGWDVASSSVASTAEIQRVQLLEASKTLLAKHAMDQVVQTSGISLPGLGPYLTREMFDEIFFEAAQAYRVYKPDSTTLELIPIFRESVNNYLNIQFLELDLNSFENFDPFGINEA